MLDRTEPSVLAETTAVEQTIWCNWISYESHHDSTTAEATVKVQSDATILRANFMVPILFDILL